MKCSRNSADKMYASSVTSRPRPMQSIRTAYTTKPTAIPSLMLNASGITRIVKHSRDRHGEIAKIDFQHALHHVDADDHERGRGRQFRDCADHRREKHRQQKARGDHQTGQPRPAALLHAGGGFDVARRGGGAQARAEHRRPGVGDERAPNAAAGCLARRAIPARLHTPISVPTLSKRSTKSSVSSSGNACAKWPNR